MESSSILPHLPPELWSIIFNLRGEESFGKIASVCKSFYQYLNTNPEFCVARLKQKFVPLRDDPSPLAQLASHYRRYTTFFLTKTKRQYENLIVPFIKEGEDVFEVKAGIDRQLHNATLISETELSYYRDFIIFAENLRARKIIAKTGTELQIQNLLESGSRLSFLDPTSFNPVPRYPRGRLSPLTVFTSRGVEMRTLQLFFMNHTEKATMPQIANAILTCLNANEVIPLLLDHLGPDEQISSALVQSAFEKKLSEPCLLKLIEKMDRASDELFLLAVDAVEEDLLSQAILDALSRKR